MRLQVIRSALRSLRRSRGFFAVAVVTLGLALGLATATFTILDAVLHPYVPYQNVERLFRISQSGNGAAGHLSGFDHYIAIRDETHLYDEIAFYGVRLAIAGTSARVDQRLIATVSGNLFPLLGVAPVLGRSFARTWKPEDGQSAMVSYDIWRSRFADRALEDAALTIDDRTYTVIGVMPPEMRFPWSADIWLRALPGVDETRTGLTWVSPVVRLRPGITEEDAGIELAKLDGYLTQRYGTGSRPFEYRLHSLRGDPLDLNEIHVAMAGAAVLVVLIACANLANLMLARGLASRPQLAVRRAMGADRAALVGPIVSEAALIALVGGAAGLLLSAWGVDLIRHLAPDRVAFLGVLAPHPRWQTFAFAFAAAGSTTVLFGLLPAVRISNVDPAGPLRDAAFTTAERQRGRYSGLVIAQVALALVVMVAAGLLSKAAQRVAQYDFGYDPERLLSAYVRLPQTGEREKAGSAHYDIVERARAVSGVRAAATLGYEETDGFMVTSDATEGERHRLIVRSVAVVSPAFLRTMGIAVIRGRDFEQGDGRGEGVVIVDEDAARALWPYASAAVGRVVKLGDDTSDRPWLPVIGVARRASLGFSTDPDMRPTAKIYLVHDGPEPVHRQLIVRTSGHDGRTAIALQRALEPASPPGMAVTVHPWFEWFDDLVNARRFVARLFVLFGVFALGLTAVGLYGVLAYATSRRMREYGIRIALGASGRDMAKLVVRDGLVMVLAGTGVGAFGAMWTAQIFGIWLYDVHPADAWSLLTAEIVLTATALLACAVPALRARRADPLEVLRAV